MTRDLDLERRRMVERDLEGRGIRDPEVLRAMGAVPREAFLPRRQADMAYLDRALPIGEGQTISQPYMVAAMTEALQLGADDTVLEVGTGSGYQTAVLAEIAREVYTIERHQSLSRQAREKLEELGHDNVLYLVGDGTMGWPEHAPYDAILVTAGAPAPPEPLKQQLAEGGRLVLPVGSRSLQDLTRYVRRGDRFEEETLMGCRFVPLLGEEGW